MREPRLMTMQTIKSYANNFLKENNDKKSILYTKKSLIEHKQGDMTDDNSIINSLSKKPTFDWIWKITDKKYYTKVLSEDGYECYELIEDINGWDSTLIILPPSPSDIQKQKWKKIDNYVSQMSMRYVMW